MPSPVRPRYSATRIFAAAMLGMTANHAAAADLSANVGVVSDYRFRGLSLSNRRPALQGGVDLGFAGGWYAGTWGSTIANYGGSHVEVDLFGGKSGQVAGFDYSIGAAVYLYPRGDRVNYGEMRAELSRTLGPVTLGVEGNYVPRQHNTTTTDIYVGARAGVALPHSPVSFTLRGGYETGFYAHKLDWEAGVAAGNDRWSGSLSLVGSDYEREPGAEPVGRTGIRLALATNF